MKNDALASVEHRNDAQKEHIAQAIEIALQIHGSATDLTSLNALRITSGTHTASQTAPFQAGDISGQSESD